MRVLFSLVTDSSAVGNTYTPTVTETGRCLDFALSAIELESDPTIDLGRFGFALSLLLPFGPVATPRQGYAGFATSFGDGDVGNTNVVGQFDHGCLPHFFEQFLDGKAHECVHAICHLCSSQIMDHSMGTLNSGERRVKQPYEDFRVSFVVYAGKDNFDSFSVCS